MRAVVGFIVGAAAVALVATDRGRKLVSDMADEVETLARERIREIATPGPQAPEEGEESHDEHGRSPENAC